MHEEARKRNPSPASRQGWRYWGSFGAQGKGDLGKLREFLFYEIQNLGSGLFGGLESGCTSILSQE